jgi:hypothetical protein
MPGIIAGIAPMALYILAMSVDSHHVELPPAHPPLVDNGFQAHLLIFTIANSVVSVTSSFPRISRLPSRFRGRAPHALNYCSLGVVLAASLLYGFVESGSSGGLLNFLTGVGAAISVALSFYIELAFARIHIMQKRRPRPRVTETSGNGPKLA